MKPRRLTVSYTQPESRARRSLHRPRPQPMPFLRLQGRWLDRAGFQIGKPVRVLVCEGVMILEALHAERD